MIVLSCRNRFWIFYRTCMLFFSSAKNIMLKHLTSLLLYKNRDLSISHTNPSFRVLMIFMFIFNCKFWDDQCKFSTHVHTLRCVVHYLLLIRSCMQDLEINTCPIHNMLEFSHFGNKFLSVIFYINFFLIYFLSKLIAL